MIFARRRYHADNYVYLLAAGDDAVLVDPGDAAAALALCEAHRARPRWILHTHGHADHTGGSAQLRGSLGAEVLGHGGDAARFAPDVDVGGRGALALGALRLALHEAPGHTPGSILVEWEGRLLTGDTLFWAGAGNCRHGGDPARLARTFLDVLGRLDGALEIHPGHDYAARNLPFALALEPGNAAASARLAAAEAARAAGEEPAPSTLALERQVNPFLRLDAPGVRGAVAAADPGADTPARRFVALRALRDAW